MNILTRLLGRKTLDDELFDYGFHHILLDGDALPQILDELARQSRTYFGMTGGRDVELLVLPIEITGIQKNKLNRDVTHLNFVVYYKFGYDKRY